MEKRIIINTKDKITYTGTIQEVESLKDKPGILLELDEKSGLKLWCPEENIEKIIDVEL